MKKFLVPEVEVVFFGKQDIVATSCKCVDCAECPEGKNLCQCHSYWTADYTPGT